MGSRSKQSFGYKSGPPNFCFLMFSDEFKIIKGFLPSQERDRWEPDREEECVLLSYVWT